MDLPAETDENLMMCFGRGDAAAFETLYRRHESRLFRYLYRQLHDQASAEDIMQEVWIAVARNARSYEPSARFTTWLFTMARNRMIDVLRRRRPVHSLEQGAGEQDEPLRERLPGDARDEPHRQAESSQAGQALLEAVARLPADQRDAFLMQAEGDMSLAQIAEISGSTFETVKSRLRYARARLRQVLWEYA